MKQKKIKRILKWAAGGGVLLFLVLLILLYYDRIPIYWQRLQDGNTHPAGLVAAYVILPMIGCPIMPLLILLGVRFGSLYGTLIMIFIMPIHLAVSYWVVQTRVQGWIEHLIDSRSVDIPKLPEKHRFSFSFLFMAVPGLSYTLKNYLLPMSGLSFPLFMICGWLPQAVLGIPFVVMGAAAAQYSVILLAALIGVYIFVFVFKKWLIRLYHLVSSRLTNPENKGDN